MTITRTFFICFLFIAGNTFAQQGAKLRPDVSKKQVTSRDIDYKEIGAPMPSFLLIDSNGKHITNKDLQNKANLFLMIFNPTCEHCEEMTMQLEKNISLFNKTKVLLATKPNQVENKKYIMQSLHTKDYPPFIIGLDSSHLIDRTFLYKNLPQINIYNKKRKLIKVFCGDTPIDSLKSYIQ
jgi:hypothetical protein